MYDTKITRCCGHLRTSTLARHRLPAIVDPIVHVVVRLRWIDMGMSIDSGQQVQWWWWLGGGIAVLIMDSALLLPLGGGWSARRSVPHGAIKSQPTSSQGEAAGFGDRSGTIVVATARGLDS